jgi:uncharacterized membrane protein
LAESEKLPELKFLEQHPHLDRVLSNSMKRSIIILATTLLTASVVSAEALSAYKTPQGQVIITGLKPRKLYGVIAKTGKGYGVNNFSSTPCGEIIIDKAANFPQLTINKQKISPKSLPVKTRGQCTQR